MKIYKSPEFEKWMSKLELAKQKFIYSRLYRITEHGHFGDAKHLGDGLAELRWKNGFRVYFIRDEEDIYLLIGGLKNGQVKDIKKARILHQRYARFKG